jgi:hypothetical protein
VAAGNFFASPLGKGERIEVRGSQR